MSGTAASCPTDYQEQTTATIPAFLQSNASHIMEVLATTDPADLEAVEMGDGNLNLVFIVTNKKDLSKQVIIKQALPYVRCVGESWPMTLERAYFEYKALSAFKQACPEFVPTVFYFSRQHALMAMQFLAPPNIILRKGLIQGVRYPTMASDMGSYSAKTLFQTSGFKLQPSQLREQVEFWSQNSEMCALTEQVIFKEPYIPADNNRWTTPQLDGDKKAIENDLLLLLALAKLKNKFITETQALLHADLHSGSVMCSPEAGATYIIDPEFAFYGPMGFDTGLFIANLLLSYVSQAAHDSSGGDYADWLLEQVCVFWSTFVSVFTTLWNDSTEHTGYLFERSVFSPDDLKQAQQEWFATMLSETLAFAGCEMIRRIVGIAHVEDLESISDQELRAKCERRGLEIGKVFVKNPSQFASIEEAIAFAKKTV